ncbi:MAG: ABC transporter substrate-binding protein [Devosia sp.]|uniref:ABC transporter substrate-binding protein n=1 Tax=Devosia sp. TaxID=1871048 RepID=UPI0033921077
MSFTLSRRQVLLSGTAALAASALGTLPSWAQANALRLYFWGSQPRADRTYGVTNLYSEANPDIAIDGEFLGWGDYWTKLATQTAGGNAPDIIQMDYRYIVEYANRGTLAPLDGFVGSALKLDDFDADQIEGGKVNGQLYGISLGANSGSLLYNNTAIAEAGIEFDPANVTYEELLTLGEAFAAAAPRGRMKLLSDGSVNDLALESWLRQKGKALFTAEGAVAFEAADLAEWFELWGELRTAGACAATEDQVLDTGSIDSALLTLGSAASTFTTSNQLVGFQAAIPDDVGIGIYPKIAADSTGGQYRKPSMFFSVAGTSAQQEQAAAFISYFVNDVSAGKVLGVERGIPCSASVRDAISPELDAKNRAALDYVAGLGDVLGALPPAPPPAAGEVATALTAKAQEIGFGMTSPTDGANALFDDINAILARAS